MSAARPLAGVIGTPIGHSLSPRLHGHWLRTLGLAGHYVPMEVAAADLERVLAAMPRMGFVGCNVTIPHKEAVLGLADRVTERAASIGAANTLSFDAGGRIEADNTDGVGFLENLRSNAPGWTPAKGPAMIFGAGGAARAVVSGLLDGGAPEIRLANRTRARAEALRCRFGARITVCDWEDGAAALAGAATVVNTTSLGMAGQPPFDIALDGLAPDTVATDIVYVPLETPFLAAARRAGCETVDGLGMLIHQAVPGFARWFGTCPVVDDAVRAAILA